jgi:hypothetical protein
MQETSVDEVRKKCKRWSKEKTSWHFHALHPGCIFNSRIDKHAFVLENRTNDETFVVYSDNEFNKLSQELLKLKYDNNILDKSSVSKRSKINTTQPILEQIKKYSSDHISWHHHMLFPDCIFNRHSGKWNIVLEGQGQDIFEAIYDEEPRGILQQIEIAYFEEFDPTFKP